jgi:lipid II:glycine glycyltransferase (peptidoglycan interpeptide bridge formation enzyme)
MMLLRNNGMRSYNLGGVPMTSSGEIAGQGLYRFKAGFGASPVHCGGLQWIFDPIHMRMHSTLSAIRRFVP